MSYTDKLSQCLADLGKTPDKVAATLDAHGVRGVRNAARFLNPIVRYAQDILREEGLTFDVMEPGILRLVQNDGTSLDTPLPKAVQGFLDRFNRGEYPFLELHVS